MEYQTYTLNNGLRIIHKSSKGNVSYCGYIINTGTRDEKPDEFGMAHFVEHMLFKGTKKRKSYHIINRMENVGGELNAYTNKEETVLYATFLEEDTDRAIDLLNDIICNSTFPQTEIEKEINVVIDEIHSYEDSPSELIYDEFENLIFSNSQLGHNILGEEYIIENFNTHKTKAFYDSYYHPENMIFFFLGNTSLKKIIKLLEKQSFQQNICDNILQRTTTNNLFYGTEIVNKKTSQGHIIMGYKGYELGNTRRKTLQLLNNILGGNGMNSRLNLQLREKKGYVYNVESSLTSYTDTGLLTIYFGCDPKNINKCVNLTLKEIDILKNKKLTDYQLSIAKKQIIGQISIATDTKENVALSIGKSFLHFGRYDSLEETINKIEKITANDILDVANEIFRDDQMFKLIYN